MTDLSILGSKGESKPHTPVESPDSLINVSYANILDGISEGPIVGLVNGAQSIYLDRTPLANSDGSLNFTGVSWEQRTGEHDQDHIAGFPAVESQISVGVELKASQPWVQSFSNLELSAVRIQLAVGALVQTESDGDRGGYKVAYEIDLSTDDSDYQVVNQNAFDGKTTTGYQRSIRIELPKAERGWRLRVRRTTPDSTTSNIQATTSIGTYTEIIDAKLQYPYTALCGLKIDASQFSAVPERAYRIRGRIVQVPSNYDPVSRAYSGTWDGTFKLAWTDCPPWIWRDIVLNERYGLGRFIDASQVDKWGLYQIAQYCDALVSDGKGGQEPRFTCNVYLQSRADALTVLQDLASVFRGMSYYAGGEVACAADMPGDPVYTYTNANVIDGKFNRPGSSGSTRFSVAKVAWSDRENFGNQRVEYVQDQKALVRYGVRETEVTAFGCVSQGQAQRAGQYILLTNRLETGTITFSVGLDGTICRPGDIIRVADEHYAGIPLAGRIKDATATSVTLDNDVTAASGDTLVVILPKGVAETRIIRSVVDRVVTVTEAFSAVPVKDSVYTIETAELVAETYRVLSVNENFGDDKLQYDIVAVARNASKFDAIDNGAQIVIPPTSVLPAAVQAPPTNIDLTTFDTLNQGINVATMRITWDPPRGAQSYRVWWKRNNGDWIYAGVTYTAALEVRGIYTGTYTARVAAVGVAGNSSVWAYSDPTQLYGKTGEPPSITSLTTESLLFGIGIKWTFPDGAEDTQRTELWYSEGTDLELATKLSDLAYPQNEHVMQGLRAGQRFFFWARLVDRTGNVGPFFPVAPTVISGVASMDAGPILEQIKDQITESELGQELTDRIDLIDKEGPGSVNERLGEVRSDLSQQIVDVNNSLGQVQSELQQQIDSIADLADSMPYKPDQAYTAGQGTLGEDGKLYQAKVDVPAGNPPPNATYWIDIGQTVQTANGLAARVGTVETSVTELNGEVDAQAQQIDGLRTSIDGKADASTVSSLSNRVTQNEQGLSSQGQALTGVQNSLNTTNQNVTAAQQAAQAAADAAGAKGKVLYQSTVPAVADRLAQNLWIDTTGNANTPKRWSGSAWVAVTDKVATDAAAAAASALSQVATKADASTVQALTNTVTQQGQDITAAGQAITNINTSLSQVGGENLLYNPSFDKASAASANVADGWYWRTQTAVTVVPSLLPSALGAGGKRQRLEVSGLIAGTGTHYVDFVPESAPADFRPPVYEGVVGTASIYIRGSSGLMVQIYMQYKDAAGVTIGTHGPVNVSTSPVESYNRIVLTGLAAPAGSVRVDILYRIRSAPGSSITAGFVDLDKAQYEHSPVVTGWRDNGQVNASAIAANATATTALTGRVGLTEQGLTSVSGSITELNNTIGDVGGENLFYNPTFNSNGSGSDIADGWAMEGSAVSVDSRVTSWLNSGEKAIRVEVSGVGNAGPYKSVRPTGGTPDRRPKVAEGQTLTASVYLRGTAGLGFRFFLQWINAAGSSISAPNSLMFTITPGGERVQYSGVAPAGAVSCYVYLRIYSATGAVTSGHVEMARPQFEYGTRATGWRDNGQVNAAATSAVSTAVDSLGSTVTQQGNSITSVSNRTTSLENSVNSTTNGLATKASASAVDALTNRVSAAEGVNTSQSSSITELNNNVGAMQDALGASGLDPAPNCLWQFDSTTEGWVASGATLAQGAGFIKITSTGSDPQLHSGTAATLSITGSLYSCVRARITRRAGAVTDWDGQLFYQTAGHGFSGSYRAIAANPNLAVGQSAVVEWDMANLAAGGTDWVDSTITRLRLDMGATSGGAFDVDWVAVGRVAPSASSRAVESLTSTVTQQGDDLSAQAQQLTGLQTSVGNNSASIQQVANAQSTLNGKINASYSVKLQVTAGGQYVAAGFGLGVENSGGVLQSTFAVMADRFAVLNPAGNGFISPFAIQNGQVFINDALISKLSVQNAIVGTTIASSTYSQFGEPLMTLNFNSGEIIMRNWSRQLTYTKINNDGIDVVVDGVRRVRMGVW
ncbi:phage tail protein [Pseudomonas capeferrum]